MIKKYQSSTLNKIMYLFVSYFIWIIGFFMIETIFQIFLQRIFFYITFSLFPSILFFNITTICFIFLFLMYKVFIKENLKIEIKKDDFILITQRRKQIFSIKNNKFYIHNRGYSFYGKNLITVYWLKIMEANNQQKEIKLIGYTQKQITEILSILNKEEK